MKNRLIRIVVISLLVIIVGYGLWSMLTDGIGSREKYEALSDASIDQKRDTYTVMQDFSTNFDADDNDERITLYTSALRTAGEMGWDDGQRWLLTVQDEEGIYVLFDDYVQMEHLEVFVYSSIEDGLFRITVMKEGHSTLKMTDYTYHSDKKVFVEEVLYDAGSIEQVRRRFEDVLYGYWP